VKEKKRIIRDLGKTIKSRDSENFSMDNDLTELNVTVNERRHIDDVNGKSHFDSKVFEILPRQIPKTPFLFLQVCHSITFF
jgi:hypothetical protein